MICAIYARKSTDQSDRHEDAKSITRQVQGAREFAAKKGWTIAEAHVYTDESVSGAEFGDRRHPGEHRTRAPHPRRPRMGASRKEAPHRGDFRPLSSWLTPAFIPCYQ